MPLSAKLEKGVAKRHLNRSRAYPLRSTASFACGENRNAAARALPGINLKPQSGISGWGFLFPILVLGQASIAYSIAMVE
jgi:hypothetical protein